MSLEAVIIIFYKNIKSIMKINCKIQKNKIIINIWIHFLYKINLIQIETINHKHQ